MAYKSDTISFSVGQLNSRYFLPAIQREFEWGPEKVLKLFDSIMRGYPVGSFLFWQLKPENKEKWQIYKFVEHYQQKTTHNELAETDGIRDLVLVLDGQQRLSSYLIGLKGSYTIKRKYKRKDSQDAWSKQKLYLNLLKDPRIEPEDGETGLRYGFSFFEGPPKNSLTERWIKVGKVLEFDTEEDFDSFVGEELEKLPKEITKGQMEVFRKNLTRLFGAIWKDEIISFHTEHDQDYDRVLDIFVRANDAGEPLTKSDLLLSMVTSKWGGVNAREEIYGFVDRLNRDLNRRNDFNKDVVMKSCLVLCDLPVQYKVENFNNANLNLIQTKWAAIRRAVESAVTLINTFGIDRETLTSANAVVPLMYYFFKNPQISLKTTSAFDVRNARAIRIWFTSCLLNNVFGGTSDNLLRDLRAVFLKSTGPDFPVVELNAAVASSGRVSKFDDEAVDSFLSLTYGRKQTFLALSLLYDVNDWGHTMFHQDHIFPRNQLDPKALMEVGVPKHRIADYWELIDSIGNLELLQYQENEEKSDQEFECWLKTRDKSFRTKHLIPGDNSLLSISNFPEFIAAREQLIKQRLQRLFAQVPDRQEK